MKDFFLFILCKGVHSALTCCSAQLGVECDQTMSTEPRVRTHSFDTSRPNDVLGGGTIALWRSWPQVRGRGGYGACLIVVPRFKPPSCAVARCHRLLQATGPPRPLSNLGGGLHDLSGLRRCRGEGRGRTVACRCCPELLVPVHCTYFTGTTYCRYSLC